MLFETFAGGEKKRIYMHINVNDTFEEDLINYIHLLCAEHSIKVDFGPFQHTGYDVLFSELNLSFKFNPLSDAVLLASEPLNDANIQIVGIWEDLWRFKRSKVESKIKSLLGLTHKIHGRETKTVKLDNEKLITFLDANHLNTPIKAKYKYGLEHKGDLVAVMSFSKGRKIDRSGIAYNSYELLRFCNKLGHTVVGGFSKLLKHFITECHPDDIMTYVDADWSHGYFMNALGFEYLEHKAPVEFWFNNATGEREYPHMVLKKRAKSMKLLEAGEEQSQFMLNNDYIKIYNTGSYKYILKLK